MRYQPRPGDGALTELVAMGPSARPVGPDDLTERVAALPDPAPVTVDVEVRAYPG